MYGDNVGILVILIRLHKHTQDPIWIPAYQIEVSHTV